MCLRIVFLICFAFMLAVSLPAQTKSVTNANLESYKEQRVRADREYRENYELWGMPSPEEIDRQIEQSRYDMEQLSEKLRAENLERERLAVELRANARLSAAFDRQVLLDSQGFDNGYFYNFSYGRRHGFPFGRRNAQPGYFGGGQFWPQGSATPPRPLIAPR